MTSSGSKQAAQVMVFIALALPLVLLPVAAFAVDAAAVASSHARLEEATAMAAESGVQSIDASLFRSGAGTALDETAVDAAVRDAIASDDPAAAIESIGIAGLTVTVGTLESIALPLNFLGAPAVTLHARSTARLTLGYDRPSSFLPFSVSTFCSEAGGMSSCSNSSRHRWGWMNG